MLACGVKVLGVSVDGVEDHLRWKEDIKIAGNAEPTFPIAAQTTRTLANVEAVLAAGAAGLS